jgi:hypothetical protein
MKFYVMSRGGSSAWHIRGGYYETFEDASFQAAKIPATRDVMVLKVVEHRHEIAEKVDV